MKLAMAINEHLGDGGLCPDCEECAALVEGMDWDTLLAFIEYATAKMFDRKDVFLALEHMP